MSEPSITNTSVLYAALILEEVSELLDGLRKVLDRLQDPAHKELQWIITNTMHENHVNSEAIRRILVTLPEFTALLNREEAVELADATTDIAVVNCGYQIASGLGDGMELYAETVGSNLSKANPVTGMIDKTPDGKWIKGVDYWKPDLEKVLYKD